MEHFTAIVTIVLQIKIKIIFGETSNCKQQFNVRLYCVCKLHPNDSAMLYRYFFSCQNASDTNGMLRPVMRTLRGFAI